MKNVWQQLLRMSFYDESISLLEGGIENIEICMIEETHDRTLVVYRAVNILCPREKVDRVRDLVNRVVP
jgi:hypothetical protein